MSILSRVAETLYWMGRQVERAENTARTVEATSIWIYDHQAPVDANDEWGKFITIVGPDDLYHETYRTLNERNVCNFLLGDFNNPGSVISSIVMARQNARNVREILPREAWEHINNFYHELVAMAHKGFNRQRQKDFTRRVRFGCQQWSGVVDGVLSRNEAYHFIHLGQQVERADMTIRIMNANVMRQAELPEADPAYTENAHWKCILDSVSGYFMYRVHMQTMVNPDDVMEFLVKDKQFPRSLLSCMMKTRDAVKELPNHKRLEDRISRINTYLRKAPTNGQDITQIASFFDDVQTRLNRLQNAIADTYF